MEQRVSKLEQLEHFYALCQQPLDKFVLLFTLIKLAIIEGKTVIYAHDVANAYRIKLFLNRFHLKAFVLAPDMPKNQIKSIQHYFTIGQFDVIVMLHTGYANRPSAMEDVQNVINFDVAPTYNSYKESAQTV